MVKKTINRDFLKGFTLLEILIVVILITMIAAFGVPQYGKVMVKFHERNAIMGLSMINQANEGFTALSLNHDYLAGTNLDLDDLNTNFSIEIKAHPDMAYSYTRNGGDPKQYIATVAWTGARPFTVGIDESPLSATNPYCVLTCPSLP